MQSVLRRRRLTYATYTNRRRRELKGIEITAGHNQVTEARGQIYLSWYVASKDGV